MFDKATRMKLRFDSPIGKLTTEDLWDLPLTAGVNRPNLDDIAVQIDKELKENGTTSFVRKSTKTKNEAVTRLKFDVVMAIIAVRQAEAEQAEVKQANAAKKQRLLELIAEKQDESLKTKSVDELQALVNSL